MVSRKRSWSDKEDQVLAEKIIQYTREGKTQLEAFKDAAEKIKRTPDACGYRWNANLRHHFQEELKQARQHKNASSPIHQLPHNNSHIEIENPLQIALQYLEYLHDYGIHSWEDIREMGELKKEKEQLKKKLAYFEQAYANAFSKTEAK